ncbi:MAG TPA: retropepsin-like aspartic protease [Chthoniobacterales bacterium]|nr:retropepsin-like aspartic protease [Chthoniobacterales bacterium]
MKTSLLGFAIAAICWLPMLSGHAAAPAPAALKTFFEHEGFGGAPMQRRFANHLFVNTMMNGRKTALMIDSGCPQTLIDRDSARRIGLRVQDSKGYVVGVSGNAERAGISKLSTLAMGNCTFQNVPVEVAAEQQINFIARPHLDGLFGAHEMSRFGMVIDCARQMIYVNPKGASAATSQKLAQLLAGRGFVRIPMHFNPEHHLEVDAALNGHPAKLIVDTGSALTLISSPIAAASGASMSPNMSYHGEGIGYFKQLTLGNLVVNNAEVGVAHVAKFVGAGLLGEEYLSWNFAVIDVGGMNLFMRPPESGPAKKR